MRKVLCMTLLAVVLAGGKANSMEVLTASELAGGIGGASYLAYKFFHKGIDVILGEAGYEAAVLGISHAPQADQMTIASDAVKACNLILKWLPNNADQNAQAISDFIALQFAGNQFVLNMLQQIAPTVERYIPVASLYMSAQVMEYLTALIQGIRDGAGTFLNATALNDASKLAKLLKLKPKYTTEKQHKHEFSKMRALPIGGGWFALPVAASPVSSKNEGPGGCCAPKPWPTQEKN